MKKNRLFALITALLLLICGALFSAAENETQTPAAPSVETGQTEQAESLPEVPEREEPTGFAGFVNKCITIRENGGLLVQSFGTKGIGVMFDGTFRDTYDFPMGYYWLTILLVAIFSYVIGSISFGVIVSKKKFGDDIRRHGSGNAGMTNMLRVYGKKAALLTFIGDAAKAAICTFVGLLLAGNGCGYVALAFCMIGHAFPAFFGFKGGKCVASTLGGMLVLEPIAAVLLLLCFIFIVAVTKYVSLGSVISAALIPIVVSGFWNIGMFHRIQNYDFFIVTICTVFYACFIVWLHRANLKRLYNGEESKTDLFGKKKKQ